MAEPGLPWGIYDVCASANISGTPKRKKVTSVTVKNLTAATTLTVDLGQRHSKAVNAHEPAPTAEDERGTTLIELLVGISIGVDGDARR